MTTIDDMREVVRELKEARAKLATFARNKGREALREAFCPLLGTLDDVARISWTQYSPYFNDGEPCVFSVHGLCIVPKSAPAVNDDDDDEDEDYSGDDEFECWGSRPPAGISQKSFDALTQVWESIKSNDLFEHIFGDGVRVCITQNSVEVDDYEHD